MWVSSARVQKSTGLPLIKEEDQSPDFWTYYVRSGPTVEHLPSTKPLLVNTILLWLYRF